MNLSQLLLPEAILLQDHAGSSTEVIEKLGELLRQKGCVKDDFVEATLRREATMPTGLPLGGEYNAAIPHVDLEYVLSPAVGMATLREPVVFRNMVDPDEEVPVQLVFMLALDRPKAQKFYNLPGVSIPHGTSSPAAPLAIPLNWLLDRIPGVKDWDLDPDNIQKRFGPTFGDPMVMGLIIGLVLGVIGYLPAALSGTSSFQDFAVGTLGLGINLAAVMVLLPRMVSILMEGLIPISESARDFMQRRASGREVYIGLDSAILIGHPAVISSALVLVPIAILLSVILPGNRILLFADLTVIPFVLAILGPICRGNIARIITIGTVVLAIGFFVGNTIAPFMTQVATAAGFAIPESAAAATYIVSIADGFIWLPLAFLLLTQSLGWIGLLIIIAALVAAWFFYLRNPRAWEASAGGPSREELEVERPAMAD